MRPRARTLPPPRWPHVSPPHPSAGRLQPLAAKAAESSHRPLTLTLDPDPDADADPNDLDPDPDPDDPP